MGTMALSAVLGCSALTGRSLLEAEVHSALGSQER